jgi:hypothetical protein
MCTYWKLGNKIVIIYRRHDYIVQNPKESKIYFFLHYSFFCLLLWWWECILAFTQVLTMYQMFCTWVNSPPQPFSFISPPPIPRVVSTGVIFTFTYMCTYFTSSYSPSYPISPTTPSFHWCHVSKVSGYFCRWFSYMLATNRKLTLIKYFD